MVSKVLVWLCKGHRPTCC